MNTPTCLGLAVFCGLVTARTHTPRRLPCCPVSLTVWALTYWAHSGTWKGQGNLNLMLALLPSSWVALSQLCNFSELVSSFAIWASLYLLCGSC